ncbi:MAG: hypothetical protein ACLGH3_03020 [Actinomycetota bacterium]
MRKLLILAALAGLVVPSIGHAEEPPIVAEGCEANLILFSRRTVLDPSTGEPVKNPATGTPVRNSTYDTQAAGCTAEEEVPEAGSNDTAVIYPFANSFLVRSPVANGTPVSGTLEFAGQTWELDLKPALTVTGDPTVYDSQDIYFAEGLALTGGEAVVTVTFGAEPNQYRHRTVYRTVA